MKIYLLAFSLSIILSIVFGLILIPVLKKLKSLQYILSYVKEHKDKLGTPTMGGVLFILSSLISYIIFSSGKNNLTVVAITITIAFSIIGFIDDFIKIKFKRNLGLTATQKIVFMLSVSTIASVFAYNNGVDFLYLPFSSKTKYLGFYIILLNIFVFIATVNGANLTDGLDGLLSSVSVIVFIAFGFLILMQINLFNNNYFIKSEYTNLSLYSICFCGSLLGYLVFNTSKASVFMGDTGSLAIGGAVSSIAIFSGNTLYIPLICIIYVLSILSVIIQVVYFKLTKGKRVFLMAPLHHHFQKKGYSESKISYLYTLTTLVICSILFIFIVR